MYTGVGYASLDVRVLVEDMHYVVNSTHCISQYKQINSFKTGIQAKHTSTKNKENLNTAIISIKNYPAINLSHHRLDTSSEN